jgi:hypothetical protein
MLVPSTLLALAGLLATTTATPIESRQTQAANDGFSLSIGGAAFDANYLQTYRLSYANSSAYIGQIKYQTYSEPLVVQGADVAGSSDGLSFISIHSAPTGFQEMYIVPHQTKPVGFSVPHGSAPAGVRTTGFTFGPAGNLLNNGRKLFYACQNAEQASINSYQIWWFGDGQPNGVSCRGPINIKQTDGCARS